MQAENRDYFDFITEDEQPEEPSSQKRMCPHCDRPISVDSLFCLYCGRAVSSGKKSNWIVATIIIVLAAFILWIAIL